MVRLYRNSNKTVVIQNHARGEEMEQCQGQNKSEYGIVTKQSFFRPPQNESKKTLLLRATAESKVSKLLGWVQER
jgi:hypothetical protein